MHFLYPYFLFALTALAVPVIIHLFNFRRYKKVFFTHVRFLSQIQKEHRSQNRLRNLLLLLLRSLLVAAIVFAFAQPYIPHKNVLNAPGRKYVFVYLDNSFSMSNQGAEGELLQAGKKKALEAVKAFSDADAFQLCTNDFELRRQRWLNKSELSDALAEVELSPEHRKFSEVAARMEESFRKAGSNNRLAFFISDFQRNTSDLDAAKQLTDVQYNLLPLKASRQNNLYIDSVWFSSPLWQVGQSNTVYARVVNSSDQKVEEGTLTLTINGKQKSLANFTVAANASQTISMVYTVTDAGSNRGMLTLEDYPITFDNTFYFAYNVVGKLPVLVINGSGDNKYITNAFSAEKIFSITNVVQGNIDYSSLSAYSFIILNELTSLPSGLTAALRDFLSNNGSVLLIPAKQNTAATDYNAFLNSLNAGFYSDLSQASQKLNVFDEHEPFFKNITEGKIASNTAMPSSEKHYRFGRPTAARGNLLLSFANGDPFLSATPAGRGYMYTLTTPLDPSWTNLTESWLLVPLLYKMSFYNNQQERLYEVIGRDNYLQVPLNGSQGKEGIIHLSRAQFDAIPPQKIYKGKLSLYVEGLIKDAGFYDLGAGNENSTAAGHVFAFDYDRQESVMTFASVSEIRQMAAGLNPQVLESEKISVTHLIKAGQAGSRLWKWFVLAALICLAAETAVIRLMKK